MPLSQTKAQEQASAGVHYNTKRPTSLISQGKLISYSYGGQAPTPVYNGSGAQGKRTARGLEQHYFEQDVKNLGKKNVDNAQNPVGPNNSNRDKYKKAAEEHLNPKPTNGKKVKC